MITIDAETDLNNVSKMLEKPKIRRDLLSMKIFRTPEEFEAWQREEPRQIFEVIPKAVFNSEINQVVCRIFVTYHGGIIE